MNTKPSLKSREVHLWKYYLLNPAPKISMRWFSEEDKLTMAKRGSHERRIQFIRVYGFFKKVLELYTHLPPEQIQLVSGFNGKPFLKCNHNQPPFYFSLSYRHNYAVLAISNESLIGVDVEEVKPIDKLYPFLLDHFSKNEQDKILSEETEQGLLSLLYTLWTMKEAFVKALAVGLSVQIKNYDLSPFLDRPTGVLKISPNVFWHIYSIPVAKKYKAAVALSAKTVNIRSFEYLKGTLSNWAC